MGLPVEENTCTVIKYIFDKIFLSILHNKCGENIYRKNCGYERNKEYQFLFKIEWRLSLSLT